MSSRDQLHEERRAKIERMLGQNMSQEDIANELGVSVKTVQRELKMMEVEGFVNFNKAKTYTPAMRDEVFEKTMDTYEVSMRAMKRTEEMVELYAERLREELGYEGERCECCGRKPLKADAIAMQSYFKGEDTVNNHLKFRAELLGQVSSSPILVIQQQDEDLMIIIEEIGRVDKQLARVVWNRLLERSARRQRRFPSFTEVVQGEFRELPPGEYGDT